MESEATLNLLRDGLVKTLQSTFETIGPEMGAAYNFQDQRLLSVEAAADHSGRYIAYVASDGLSLQHKILVEKQLQYFVNSRFPDLAGFLTYFRKKNPQTTGSNPEGTPGPRQVPAAPTFGIRRRPQALAGVKHVIAVASGKGGVGKSTVSVNLAVAMQREGLRVGILDADIYGPSVPLMLGLKGPLSIDAQNKLIPAVGYGVKAMSLGLLSESREPAIWRGPLVAKAIEQLVFDVAWQPLDYLIIDLPPGTGDVQLTLIERVALDGALVVSTPQDVALIDAHKAVTMFYKLKIPIIGLVENMAFHTCSHCGHEDPIFGSDGIGQFATERHVPILARLPLDRQIRIGGDEGEPAATKIHCETAPMFSELARKVFAATATSKGHLTH